MASRSRSTTVDWRTVELSAFTLLRGPEDFIALRVTDRLRASLREKEPSAEVHQVLASEYTAGELSVLASPSLFGEAKLLLADGLEKMNDAFLQDFLDYLKAPSPDVTIIARHQGGNRGKKLMDALSGVGQIVECKAITSDKDRSDFVQQEFRGQRRKIDAEAVRALVDASGTSLSDLASACAQLLDDTEGEVTAEIVEKYYGGRVQATAFKVADAAIEGRLGPAIALLRHALATGVSPVAVTAALAMKTRQIASIIDARIGQSQIAQTLGMAPWQAKRVVATVRFWTPRNIADAIEWVARADAEAKGQARDADYAVEKAVTLIARTARRH